MRGVLIHLLVAAAAGLTPVLLPVRGAEPAADASSADAFPGWPSTFEGRPLERLPPRPGDDLFLEETDGARMARFTDGTSAILVRWAPGPTRHVHASSGCFRALGWTVAPAPRVVDARGRSWTAYTIEMDGRRQRLRERVEAESGRSWADPTDWYWAGLLGDADGPAFAFTVVTPDE